MSEYEQLFATNLQRKLKSKVIGKIYVEVNRNDELYIKITRQGEDLKYELHLEHFSERLINGWSTEYAAYEVLRDYKNFIMKIMEERYFYND